MKYGSDMSSKEVKKKKKFVDPKQRKFRWVVLILIGVSHLGNAFTNNQPSALQ